MHEMSIASGLLEQVLAAVQPHSPARVSRVEVRFGVMRLVCPDAMELAWREVCSGTPAEDAELGMSEQPLLVRCRGCGARYRPEVSDYLCPKCGQADVDILEGNDIILDSVTCDTLNGAADE
jgi:hydrogenase nickel incorporation protein HypA/HybF